MKNQRFTFQQGRSQQNRRGGFTLVEVLIVVAIVSVLMTAAAIGLGNITGGKGTATAIANAESLFAEARTLSVSKQTNARVMVDIGDIDSDEYLRRMIVVVEETDEDGEPTGEWILSSRGYDMPMGTYFSQEYSGDDSGNTVNEESISPTNEDGTALARYDSTYAYYEFNSKGIFVDSGSNFIVGSGVKPKGRDPQTTASGGKDFAGFVIWRNGRTASYRSPEQMGEDVVSHGETDKF